MLIDTIAVILWAGVTLYAVFGGADFGSGLWDLVAGGDRRGARPRALIDVSIAPVWEANHVWLIFCLVVLWTAFPTVFAAIMTTLYIPLGLAAIGIVFRGAGFAYRHVTRSLAGRRLYGATFAISSVITPFFLGAVAGAVASGRVPIGGDATAPISSWWAPVPVFCGVLAVVVCAWLAAVFLVHEAHRQGDAALQRYFTVRAVGAGVAAGVVAMVGIVLLRNDAPELYDGLTGIALPLVAASAVFGTTALALLWSGRPRGTRPLAAGSVAAVVWAWGLAQHPWMLPDLVTVADAAAPAATLWAVVVAVAVAAVLITPAFVLLYWLDQHSMLDSVDLEWEAAANEGLADTEATAD
ncbi:MAG: cytochrome d ubiquinol oxidase subunit II [Acidimicrobiia bacterium]|nr:cytochrome d ubiquinol oxidase subunit II [Acidimicrobiia bacterium]